MKSVNTPPANRPLPAVELRVPTEEDAMDWHRVFDDPEVMEFHGGLPAELSVYEELTARQRRHHAERGFCLCTLLDPADGAVIGFTGAQPWPQDVGPGGRDRDRLAARPRVLGQGLCHGRGAGGAGAVRTAGVRQVVAMVDARNERSIAVTRRLGMRQAETVITPR